LVLIIADYNLLKDSWLFCVWVRDSHPIEST